MSTQTLAVGSPVASKYGAFGGFTGPSRPNARKQTMLLLGKSGRGKSTFTHSIPGCFVINADCTSTGKLTQAAVWPFVRSDGMPVEFNGSDDPEQGTPFQITWGLIRAKVQALIDAAKKQQPRPDVVAFDTVDRCYTLIQQWMVDEYNRTAQPDKQKSSFSELYGMSAWPASYAHFIQAVRDLRAAGYGVICLAQFGDKMIHLGENDKKLKENVPQLPDNLYLPLRDYCETVGLATSDDVTETPMVPLIDSVTKQPRMRNGKPEMLPGKPEIVRTFRLTFDRRINDDLKARVMVPDVPLGRIRIKGDGTIESEPNGNPWDTYEAVYNANAK